MDDVFWLTYNLGLSEAEGTKSLAPLSLPQTGESSVKTKVKMICNVAHDLGVFNV